MESEFKNEPIANRELVLVRLIEVPASKLFRCWTEPALMVRWFTLPPWKTKSAELDVRAGGQSLIVMESPDGTVMSNPPDVYLEVIPNRKIVFTDAFANAWEPSNKPFMVGTITFEDEGGKTRYTARVQHWSVADKVAHEQMGFKEGWGIATDQLESLAKTL